MARKRPPTKTVRVQNIPPLSQIEADLARGNLAQAVNAIQVHHNMQPTAESAAVFRRALEAYLQEAIDRNDAANFDRFWTLTDKLGSDAPEWATTQAMLLAKFGRMPQALMLLPANAPDAARALLTGHAADRAMRFRSYAGLAEEWHADFKTITIAFSKYEKKDDEAARELLNSIGLQSPFLDWKVLLRGLMAYVTHNDTLALENWQRLHAERVPATLIAPMRAMIDSTFKDARPPHARSLLQQRSTALNASGTLKHLERLRTVLGRSAPLDSAWSAAEKAWADLQPTKPALAKRLSELMYYAIMMQGEPYDTDHYRRLFGVPKDDPDFYRLNAMVLEQIGDLPQAMTFWEKYERWLGTKPAGWPPAMVTRARSMIMVHLGDFAATIEVGETIAPDFFREAMRKILRVPPTAKATKHSAKEYFEKAAFHDPTSIEPLVRMMKLHDIKQEYDAAKAAARKVLALEPNHEDALTTLATSALREKDYDAVFAYRQQALIGNPLSTEILSLTATAWSGLIRVKLAAGDTAAAKTILLEHWHRFASVLPISAHSLRATLADIEKDDATAAEQATLLMAVPNARLAGHFLRSMDAELAKLKPARKTAAKKALTDAMKTTAAPLEIERLYAAFAGLIGHGIDIRGLKTFEGKVLKLIEIVPSLPTYPIGDYETLLLAVAKRQQWKALSKVTARLSYSIPKSAAIKFFMILSWHHSKSGYHNARFFEIYDAELSARSDEVGAYYRHMKPIIAAQNIFDDGFDDDFDIEDDDDDFSFFNTRR